MIRSTTITTDYSLPPSALADAPATLVEARQPVIVWGPPAFLPPGDATGRWLVNLEELPSAVPMVQAASTSSCSTGAAASTYSGMPRPSGAWNPSSDTIDRAASLRP